METGESESREGNDLEELLLVERDLWKRRARDCERRWEESLALEAERAELRRQASEVLTRDFSNLLAQRDGWQRRATAAEALVADAETRAQKNSEERDVIDLPRIEAIEAERDALVAERDEWRKRALGAERARGDRPGGSWLG